MKPQYLLRAKDELQRLVYELRCWDSAYVVCIEEDIIAWERKRRSVESESDEQQLQKERGVALQEAQASFTAAAEPYHAARGEYKRARWRYARSKLGCN